MPALAELHSYVAVPICLTAYGVIQMYALLEVSSSSSREGSGPQHVGLSHSSLCAGTSSGTSSDVQVQCSSLCKAML